MQCLCRYITLSGSSKFSATADCNAIKPSVKAVKAKPK